MAQLTLRLIDDAGVTADLPLGIIDRNVSPWTPASAPVNAQSLMPYSVTDGPAVHERVRNLVREEFNLFFRQEMTHADLRVKVQAIEKLLEAANAGEKVYLEYNTGETLNPSWRSPIQAGDLAWQSDMRQRWRDMQANVRVTAMREPWWERSTTQSVTVMESAANDTLSIDAATEVLPAPLALTLTMPAASRTDLRLYMAMQIDPPSTPVYRVASTIASRALTASTNTVLLNGVATPNTAMGWRRIIVQNNGTAGQRTLARNGPLWLRGAIGVGTEKTVQGSWKQAHYYESRESRFTDLGSFYFDASNVLFVDAWIGSDLTATGAMTVLLVPTDGYRSYHLPGASGSGTVIDTDGEISGTLSHQVAADGSPLLINPRHDIVVFSFAETENGGSFDPSDVGYSAEYRPRRLTL